MDLNEFKQTGGARVGLGNASSPLASLTVSKNLLVLKVSIVGTLYFRPSDVIAIEPYSQLFAHGIQIRHRVENYSKTVVFAPRGSTGDLLAKIAATGFLSNTGPIPREIESRIAICQAGGSFALKTPAVITIVVIWNALFIGGFIKFAIHHQGLPFGRGPQLAFGFMFLLCLTLLIAEPLRTFVLKEGRDIDEIKKPLYFLMLLSAFMFIMFTVIASQLGDF